MPRLRHYFACVRPILAVLCVIATAGCAATFARTPVPQGLVAEAQAAGFTNVRSWGDAPPADIGEKAGKLIAQLRASGIVNAKQGQPPTLDYLALSGGGSDGAFGAGLLVGWTLAGNRPEFTIVTGISTGALIAPFAFLGPHYDATLREIYTQYSTSELVNPQILNALFGGLALADNAKLAALIALHITPKVLREIAFQHGRGRRLLIGTTNLDAQRPVVWDIGAIASSGGPGALQLVHQVLLASAAIPGVFPPIFISVNADGATYDEMHVDGGTTQQVFFLPGKLNVRELDQRFGLNARHRLFIVRNSKLEPEWEPVGATTLSIAGRSISTLIKSQGIGDLDRIYSEAEASRLDFNLAAVPASFDIKSSEPFDQAYMTQLFNIGEGLARKGYPWAKSPVRSQL